MHQVFAFGVLVTRQRRHELGALAGQLVLAEHLLDDGDGLRESLEVARLDALLHLHVQSCSHSADFFKTVLGVDRAEELSPLTGLLRGHYAALASEEADFRYRLHRLQLEVCWWRPRPEHLLVVVRGPRRFVVINELDLLPAIRTAHSLLPNVGLRCVLFGFKKIMFRSDSIFNITAHIGCLNRVVGDVVVWKCCRLVHLGWLAGFKDLRTCVIVRET